MKQVQGAELKPYAVAMFEACEAVQRETEPSANIYERTLSGAAMVAAAILAEQSDEHLADFETMLRKLIADMRAGHARNGNR